MILNVRLRFSKPLLHGAERLCFAVGFACMGLCAAMLLRTWFFQSYENWAFEQLLRGEPVSLAEFFGQAAPFSAPAAQQASPLLSDEKINRVRFQAPADRSVVGRIEIPRIGLKAVILEGIAQRTLALSVGHIPGTALPGRTGNVGLAGHRDTFFRVLRNVKTGDSIILRTLDGSYEYRVKSSEVVGPRETRVLADSAEPALTLVTCYPFYFVGPAPERFIVHARRIL